MKDTPFSYSVHVNTGKLNSPTTNSWSFKLIDDAIDMITATCSIYTPLPRVAIDESQSSRITKKSIGNNSVESIMEIIHVWFQQYTSKLFSEIPRKTTFYLDLSPRTWTNSDRFDELRLIIGMFIPNWWWWAVVFWLRCRRRNSDNNLIGSTPCRHRRDGLRKMVNQRLRGASLQVHVDTIDEIELTVAGKLTRMINNNFLKSTSATSSKAELLS